MARPVPRWVITFPSSVATASLCRLRRPKCAMPTRLRSMASLRSADFTRPWVGRQRERGSVTANNPAQHRTGLHEYNNICIQFLHNTSYYIYHLVLFIYYNRTIVLSPCIMDHLEYASPHVCKRGDPLRCQGDQLDTCVGTLVAVG
jgi:hypothetical protein